MLLVHRGAAAEGSTVPGSLGTRRQVGALAHLSRVPGLQSHGAVRVPPARQDALGDGQLEKLTEPLRARGSLAAQRCAALATEVSAVLTQMCAGHPASAAGKLHPKSKVGSEGGTRGWTAGLPAGRRGPAAPGARGGRGPHWKLSQHLPNRGVFYCLLFLPHPNRGCSQRFAARACLPKEPPR